MFYLAQLAKPPRAIHVNWYLWRLLDFLFESFHILTRADVVVRLSGKDMRSPSHRMPMSVKKEKKILS